MRTRMVVVALGALVLAAAWWSIRDIRRDHAEAPDGAEGMPASQPVAAAGLADEGNPDSQGQTLPSQPGAQPRAVDTRSAAARASRLSDDEELERALATLADHPELVPDDVRDLAALLAAETRDQAWASGIEHGVATHMAALAAGGGEVPRVPYVRCATTVCEIRAVSGPVSPTSPSDWQNIAGGYGSGALGTRLSHASTMAMPASDNRRSVYITYLTR